MVKHNPFARLLQRPSRNLRVYQVEEVELDRDSSDQDSTTEQAVNMANLEPPKKYIIKENKDLSLFQLCCVEILNNPFLLSYFLIRPGLELKDIEKTVHSITGKVDGTKHVITMNKICNTVDGLQQFRKRYEEYQRRANNTTITRVELKIDYQEALTDVGLRGILLQKPVRDQLKQLRSISLVKCQQISDKSITRIVKAYGPQLTNLALQGTKVTSKGIQAVAAHCPYLTALDISHLRNVEDADIEYLAQRCSRLDTLDIRFIKPLTDKSMAAIGRNCHNLTALRVAFNKNVSGGVALLSGCMHLQTLHLQHCSKVGVGDLFPVVASCLLLQQLSVRGCVGVSLELLGYIAEHCLCLRLLDVVDTRVDGREGFGILAHSEAIRRSLKEYTSNNMTALCLTPDLYRLFGV